MYKCISKKDSFKNLTLNKDYEGTEVGNFIEVINDSNVKTRYDKKYFKTVVPRPRIRRINMIDFINEFIVISRNRDDDEDSINITYRERNNNFTLFFDQTRNSCGIRFIDGIEQLITLVSIIETNLPDNVEISEYNNSQFLVELLRKIILYFEEDDHYFAFYMFTTHPDSRIILSEFDRLFTSTEEESNPNSGNYIKVWVASRTQLGIN